MMSTHLLLVEDDETDVMLFQRHLANCEHDIELVVARDGTEALEMLRDGNSVLKPFLIVTDLNMPGMSGHELLGEIRADKNLKNSVIFVFSSSRLADDIAKCYQQKVAGYLSKQRSRETSENALNLLINYCQTAHLPH